MEAELRITPAPNKNAGNINGDAATPATAEAAAASAAATGAATPLAKAAPPPNATSAPAPYYVAGITLASASTSAALAASLAARFTIAEIPHANPLN